MLDGVGGALGSIVVDEVVGSGVTEGVSDIIGDMEGWNVEVLMTTSEVNVDIPVTVAVGKSPIKELRTTGDDSDGWDDPATELIVILSGTSVTLCIRNIMDDDGRISIIDISSSSTTEVCPDILGGIIEDNTRNNSKLLQQGSLQRKHWTMLPWCLLAICDRWWDGELYWNNKKTVFTYTLAWVWQWQI